MKDSRVAGMELPGGRFQIVNHKCIDFMCVGCLNGIGIFVYAAGCLMFKDKSHPVAKANLLQGLCMSENLGVSKRAQTVQAFLSYAKPTRGA